MKSPSLIYAALLASACCPALAAEPDNEGPQIERIIVTHGGDGADMIDGAKLQGGERASSKRIVIGDATRLAALGDLPELAARMATAMPPMHGKPVKNAPYSVEVISEKLQTLADGNQITHTNSSMSYRDSAGRTRQEVRDAKGEVRHVVIDDSVAGVNYMLDPRDKRATKLKLQMHLGRAGAQATPDKDGETAHGKAERRIILLDSNAGEGDKGHTFIVKQVEKHIEHGDGDTGKLAQEDVQIRLADGAAGTDLAAQLGPMMGASFGDVKWSSKPSRKDLGSREFDGVKAEGKLRSYEIPAGAIGNKNAIVVSDETWFAPELQITVYSKHSDPRSGETVYRLAGLKRTEPAAALFTVPADYTVREVGGGMAKVMERREHGKDAARNAAKDATKETAKEAGK
ncbi:MAG: hypothetical protein V4582_03890 [Pseudomonadota bacterium]